MSTLLVVTDLVKTFDLRGQLLSRSAVTVQAVSGVSFEVGRGETLSLVGESGCGKTTIGRCLVRVYRPTGGSILFHAHDGSAVDLADLNSRAVKPWRKEIQMVFQVGIPMVVSSLSPWIFDPWAWAIPP